MQARVVSRKGIQAYEPSSSAAVAQVTTRGSSMTVSMDIHSRWGVGCWSGSRASSSKSGQVSAGRWQRMVALAGASAEEGDGRCFKGGRWQRVVKHYRGVGRQAGSKGNANGELCIQRHLVRVRQR